MAHGPTVLPGRPPSAGSHLGATCGFSRAQSDGSGGGAASGPGPAGGVAEASAAGSGTGGTVGRRTVTWCPARGRSPPRRPPVGGHDGRHDRQPEPGPAVQPERLGSER